MSLQNLMCSLRCHREKYGDIQLLATHGTIHNSYNFMYQIITLIPSVMGVPQQLHVLLEAPVVSFWKVIKEESSQFGFGLQLF